MDHFGFALECDVLAPTMSWIWHCIFPIMGTARSPLKGTIHKSRSHNPKLAGWFRAVATVLGLLVCVYGYSQKAGGDDDLILKELEMLKVVNDLVLDGEGFLWVGTNEGLFRFDGYDFDLAGGETLPHLAIPFGPVTRLHEDSDGFLWVGTQAEEIFVIPANRQTAILLYSGQRKQQKGFGVEDMLDLGDQMWFAVHEAQILCCDKIRDINKLPSVGVCTTLPGHAIKTLNRLETGDVFVGTSGRQTYFIVSSSGETVYKGMVAVEYPVFYTDTILWQTYCQSETEVYLFYPYQNTLEHVFSLKQVAGTRSPTWHQAISSEKGYGIWIGNRKGNLLWYIPDTRTYLDYSEVLSNQVYSGRYFSTSVGIPDGSGGLWIGTNQGLIHVNVRAKQHFTVLSDPRPEAQSGYSARGVIKLPDGSLFVGGYGGLFRYNQDGSVKEYTTWKATDRRHVNPLAYDFLLENNNLWIATEGNGTLRLDLRTDSLHWMQGQNELVNPSSPDKVYLWQFKLFRDSQGVLWVGTSNGLFVMRKDGTIARFEVKGEVGVFNKVYDIVEDSTGSLWIGSGDGLVRLSQDRTEFQYYPDFNQAVTCIRLMSDGRLMIGTLSSGLAIFNPGPGSTESFTTDQGLAHNGVCAIQNSSKDIYWVSTNAGLSRFDLKRNQFMNFYREDGLPDNEFNHGSSLLDEDGTLYFGGVRGVVRFSPAIDISSEKPAEIRVSKVAYHDGKDGATKYMHIVPGKPVEINLGFRDKYFTVYYSTTDCTPNPRQAYAYKLEGLHSDWQVNNTKNTIQFTGLQSGHYLLKIRSLAEFDDSDANLLQIPISIGRPFYREWWAYLSYVAIFASISFLILREYFMRQHMRRKLQLESEHRMQLEDINKSKSAFFTNITHEFKTPLTLIQSPAQEIQRKARNPEVIRHAGMITRNTQAMLSLVNQLLELGKLEANLEQPHFYRLDLIMQMRQWVSNFRELARQKEIELIEQYFQDTFYVDFDPVKMEKVVNNLLSNAIKFTPEGGRVSLSIEPLSSVSGTDEVLITVTDNGPGIDPAEQVYIFDRFFQGKHSVMGGTGIGLAFVRELIRIHHGRIELESTPGEGTAFKVIFPAVQKDSINAGYTANTPPDLQLDVSEPAELLPGDELPILLIAEDNPDILDLIATSFSKDYTIITTMNGRDAHREAIELIPDIIVSDIMMPLMDGLTLTRQLKTNRHTSHIPVVLLTAKDGVESRIEGRSQGADAYLSKPFSVHELQLTIRNLLNLKARWMEKAAGQANYNVREVPLEHDPDQTFYQQFLDILEENLSESSLQVEDFTRKLGTSRTQLHRKLKALTGLSVNQLVRNMRLQRALALLKGSGLSISEIAYEVGFSSPSYFTERFREHYGYPPSEADKVGTGPSRG